jgi:hypothetical protein
MGKMIAAAAVAATLLTSGCFYTPFDSAELFGDDGQAQLAADDGADAGADAAPPVDATPPPPPVDDRDKACFPVAWLEGSNVAQYNCHGVMLACPEDAPMIATCGGGYPWMGTGVDHYRPACCPAS